jgi:hypothetical protein
VGSGLTHGGGTWRRPPGFRNHPWDFRPRSRRFSTASTAFATKSPCVTLTVEGAPARRSGSNTAWSISRSATVDLHARLLAAIANLDLACAAENDRQLAAAGAELVETWRAGAAVMKIEEAANRERERRRAAV